MQTFLLELLYDRKIWKKRPNDEEKLSQLIGIFKQMKRENSENRVNKFAVFLSFKSNTFSVIL